MCGGCTPLYQCVLNAVAYGRRSLQPKTVFFNTMPHKLVFYFSILNAVSYGITFDEAVKRASMNVILASGISDKCGSISVGKQADFIIAGRDYKMKEIYIGGNEIESSNI